MAALASPSWPEPGVVRVGCRMALRRARSTEVTTLTRVVCLAALLRALRSFLVPVGTTAPVEVRVRFVGASSSVGGGLAVSSPVAEAG